MGISPIEFTFMKSAHDAGLFGGVNAVLEFGESNTHELDIAAAIRDLTPPGPECDKALAEAEALSSCPLPGFPWARLLYRLLFHHETYVAIDLEPKPPHVVPQDLNEPFDLGRRFDLVINNGTSEHIFNQSNFYKAVHDHTRLGGLMLHWTPCLGWADHGLYNVQPGFFPDLARANEYELLAVALGTAGRLYPLDPLPDVRDALACALMRKRSDAAFRMPMQAIYRHLVAS